VVAALDDPAAIEHQDFIGSHDVRRTTRRETRVAREAAASV
jgi:hypothetical protein